ncbi:MAG: non-canonical purine NTP pyrophosphatase [Nannocystaceae bacterium]
MGEGRGRPRRLVLASGNAHKVMELRRMLQTAVPGLEVLGQRDFGEPPIIEETASTFEGNARLKAEGIAAWLRQQGEARDTVVLADDSGVCVDALGGAPGVRSARFAGDDATDEDNNAKLVEQLTARGLRASAGHYACVLSLVRVDGGIVPGFGALGGRFEGRWDVELRVERRGTGGFGYDPHAWLPDGRTVAELGPDDKAARSHRGEATRGLLAWLTAL